MWTYLHAHTYHTTAPIYGDLADYWLVYSRKISAQGYDCVLYVVSLDKLVKNIWVVDELGRPNAYIASLQLIFTLPDFTNALICKEPVSPTYTTEQWIHKGVTLSPRSFLHKINTIPCRSSLSWAPINHSPYFIWAYFPGRCINSGRNKGSSPILDGFIVTRHEGACERKQSLGR